MATIALVDIGAAPNDGLGDPLRTAYSKTNGNDTAINDQLVAHVAEATAAHAASAISFAPAGTIGATDAQTAIEEVATESVQTAVQVPFTPAGTIAATNTQAAVEEVATDAAADTAAAVTGAPLISSEDELVGQMQIAVVATLPGSPDANTIYFVTT